MTDIEHPGDPRASFAQDQPACQTTRVVKTLWPPQSGTRRLHQHYGAALVCVRYRHDATGLRRYTTVEIVVDEGPVTGRHVDQRWFAVRIGFHEDTLRATAKIHGARWDKDAKIWHLKGAAVKKLKLESRVRPLKK